MGSLTFVDDPSAELNMEQLLNEPINDSERECLEPTLNDEEAELEEDVPALQDRVTGLVVDLSHANDTSEHAEHHVKCVHDALHELEGRAGEFRTLGLTEDGGGLLRAPRMSRVKRYTGDTLIIARCALSQIKIEFAMKVTL